MTSCLLVCIQNLGTFVRHQHRLTWSGETCPRCGAPGAVVTVLIPPAARGSAPDVTRRR